ncbi:flagellar basal-body rod protein FlgG, partial [bacterium]|nr:flagellar basal-body rod protein FlgG [bacterium]
MMRSLLTGSSGMVAQQMNMDVISNNLANVNTSGFKRSRVDFQDLLYETLRAAGSPVAEGSPIPTGIQVGLGTIPVSTQRMYVQGSLQETGNVYDIAIEGDGFFQILLPDGSTGYTRDGSFKISGDGRLVTSDGYILQPEITIPTDAVQTTIAPNGTVSVMLAGQTDPSEVGKIELARFVNPAGLNCVGRNIAKETAASGSPVIGEAGLEGLGEVRQAYVESSNVNVIAEMVKMIIAQRAYEINSKSI